MIVKNSAVLHAPPGYLTCDNLRSDSEAHLSPESEIITANHSALLNRLQPATSIRRFNQLWNRYETLAGYCRQLLVLASIRLPRGWWGAPHRVRLTLRSCKPTSSAYEQ
jgi:hypothetical protein